MTARLSTMPVAMTAWTIRNMRKTWIFGAIRQPMVATRNTPMPQSITLRRPILSEIGPMKICSMPLKNRYSGTESWMTA